MPFTFSADWDSAENHKSGIAGLGPYSPSKSLISLS